MLNITESKTVEFKQIWKDEYLKTICAFANTDGGALYIGIENTKNLIIKNENLSAIELSEKLEIPLRTTQRWIKELKDKDKIEYRGSKKTGGYFAK